MGENLHVEYKSVWKDEYLRNVAAFANVDGGVVYVGADDDGTIVGLKNVDDLLKLIPDKISTNLGIVPTVDNHVRDGLDYITITVRPSTVPVFLNGKLWVKSGNTTREVPRDELRLYLSRYTDLVWTDAPAEGLNFDDINTYAFREFKKRAELYGEFTESELALSTEALLEKLDLVTDGHPTRAAAILFRDEPTKISRAAQIIIVKMRGGDVEFSDELDAPMYMQIDMAINLIKTKYTTSPVTYDGLARVDNNPYPFEALREGLLNAVVNTDYGSKTPVKVMIFEDHLEILNFGGLPYDMDLETIMKNHTSKPRNLGMAMVFRKARYIEKYGRGFEKMIRSYEGTGTSSPEFDGSNVFFCARFTDIVHAKEIVARDFNGKPLSEDEVPADIDITLSKTENAIISIIRTDSRMSAGEIARSIGITERTVRRHISELVKKGLLSREGSDKSGRWILLK